jgi:ribonuclease T1
VRHSSTSSKGAALTGALGFLARRVARVLFLLCLFAVCAPAAHWALAQDKHAADRVALGERPQAAPDESAHQEIPVGNLPKEARATLALVKQGGPFPYRKDGSTFGNREKHLPVKARGYYREYTVPTPGARDRGARRIVAGRDGEYYYTDDHYNSFRRIRE